MLFECIEHVSDILISDLADHFDLVALVLAHVRIAHRRRKIRVLVNQGERIVDLF